MIAYACVINEENLGAIRSEHPKFDLAATKQWLRINPNGDSYFLRHPGSPFDCRYFSNLVFFQMYQFVDKNDLRELFRRVETV